MTARRTGWGEALGARVDRLLDSGIDRALPGPAPQRREAPVLALASGKGGTGKSFVASSLAVLLAERGLRPLLVDCDFGLATTHLLLGVQPRGTLQHVVEGRARPEDVIHRSPFGPEIVPGASGVQEMASLDGRQLARFAAALASWAGRSDLLLLDVGAGLSTTAVLTLASADHVLLVTQPELAALTDAYAVLKCLCRQGAPVPRFSVLVNRVRSEGSGRASFAKLDEVSRRFVGVVLHYLGAIADEPAVGLRALGEPPLVLRHPQCRASLEIRSVLDRLQERAGPFGRRWTDPGVGARFGGRLSDLR